MSDLRGHVEGIPQNQARLEAIGADVKRMGDTHRAIAELVLPAAAANVPNTTGRGTGRLAASLRAAGDDRAGWLEHGTEYGGLIENRYGYLAAAMASLEPALIDRYESGIAAIVSAHP